MQPVEDADGRSCLLLKRSGDTVLLRDLHSGESRYEPASSITAVEEPPLVSAAETVSNEIKMRLSGVESAHAIGLLALLERTGPRSVPDIMTRTTLCESDLHGLLADLQAGEFVSPTDVNGHRGYQTTQPVSDAFETEKGTSSEE